MKLRIIWTELFTVEINCEFGTLPPTRKPIIDGDGALNQDCRDSDNNSTLLFLSTSICAKWCTRKS